MSTPVRASDRDLRALAAIVSQDRTDLPADGLPPSLLADLTDQIHCDALGLDSWDSGRQRCWFSQEIPAGDSGGVDYEGWDPVFWEHYWDCQHCSYAARTGDLRSVIKTRTSTRPGNGMPPGCTPITPGRWARSTFSWCACPERCRPPPGPAGMCG